MSTIMNAIYKDSCSAVRTGRNLSNWFKSQVSINQGCTEALFGFHHFLKLGIKSVRRAGGHDGRQSKL